ncbi:MAG: S-methyl-5-thioribose-1-phosphate isomerase [Candidatus Nanoarchaeia archaeon]
MKVNGEYYTTVWKNGRTIYMIDQNKLPFEFKIKKCPLFENTLESIKDMTVRGAGAIGATAAYAMSQAIEEAILFGIPEAIPELKKRIENTRPTAQNLFYATERVYKIYSKTKSIDEANHEALLIANEDSRNCKKIGGYGSGLIKDNFKILTHCNAGWLAFVDFGTALSPIYLAKTQGKNPFVYANETRPRAQGAKLTAWELANENIQHKIIPDNASAYLMSKKEINLVIVGADRIAKNGDTANKIGTLEKAIIAKEYNIPFYVAAPTSTFDLKCISGESIPIEERSQEEILYQTGLNSSKNIEKILVCNPASSAFNPAFDVTPAKYIAGFITEKGICNADENSILKLLNKYE